MQKVQSNVWWSDIYIAAAAATALQQSPNLTFIQASKTSKQYKNPPCKKPCNTPFSSVWRADTQIEKYKYSFGQHVLHIKCCWCIDVANSLMLLICWCC